MEKGELFKQRFEVVPGEGGTFIVAHMDGSRMWTGKQWGFTNLADLMCFLQSHADVPVDVPAEQASPKSAFDLKSKLLAKHGDKLVAKNGAADTMSIALPPPSNGGKEKPARRWRSYPWA